MQKTLCILILICSLLIPTTGMGEEGKRSNTHLNYMDYIGKGNRRENLSFDEFNILTKRLEDAMKAFREALSKIRIEDANFNYATGKNWEIELAGTRKQLERAFKYIAYVRKHPNEISVSLQLYVDLMDVTQTAYDFDRITVFEKNLNNTHIYVFMWSQAFLKAHLQPLAYAKDKGKELYRDAK